MSDNLDDYAQDFEKFKSLPQDRKEFVDFAERQESRKIQKQILIILTGNGTPEKGLCSKQKVLETKIAVIYVAIFSISGAVIGKILNWW